MTGGGGLAIFAGPETNVSFLQRLALQEGKGLLPVPLGPETDLPPVLDAAEPDMELTRHPIFSFLLAGNQPADPRREDRQATASWPTAGSPIRPIRSRSSPGFATRRRWWSRRNSATAPCSSFTTTCGPLWNDWAKNPSFVVVVLKTQSYLATANRLDDPRLVGTPLDLALESAKYRGDLAFVMPGERPGSRHEDRPAGRATRGGRGHAGRLAGGRGLVGMATRRDRPPRRV